MPTSVGIVALVLAVVAVGLSAVSLAYTRRLRGSLAELRQSVQEVTARPGGPAVPAVVTPTQVVPAPEGVAPQARPEVPAAPPPQSILADALGLLVLKGEAFAYGVSQALSQERRDRAADVMHAHLRARRRARRAAERRSRRLA